MWLLRPGEWEEYSFSFSSLGKFDVNKINLFMYDVWYDYQCLFHFILLQNVHLHLPLIFCEINKSLKQLIYIDLAWVVCLGITMLRDLPYLTDLSESINRKYK